MRVKIQLLIMLLLNKIKMTRSCCCMLQSLIKLTVNNYRPLTVTTTTKPSIIYLSKHNSKYKFLLKWTTIFGIHVYFIISLSSFIDNIVDEPTQCYFLSIAHFEYCEGPLDNSIYTPKHHKGTEPTFRYVHVTFT